MKKWALVFPGQGSQAVGMGRWLYDQFEVARQVFDEASEALNLDMKALCFESPDETLALTANTQPALLCVSTATQRVLLKCFPSDISLTAGHSIGEYSSMVFSEVIPFSVAMKAVRLRGEAMQKAVPLGEGGMLATLGLSEEQAQLLCQWAERESGFSPVQTANFNCPGQIVLSGNLKAERVHGEAFREAKRIKFIPLNVSAPFHCSLMKPAEAQMKDFFDPLEFQRPKVPIVQNLTAEIESEPNRLKRNLIEQVSGSVKWTQSVQKMSSHGVGKYIECGHGSVLKGLIKKIDDQAQVFSLQSKEDLIQIEQALNTESGLS
jgi:[acyl-carrier-protein] S-malonyltransferase